MTYHISPSHRARYSRWQDIPRSEVHIPVDVAADGDDFVITAFVPGIEADALEIEILEDSVSISGEFVSMASIESAEASEDEEPKFLLRERPSGSFNRMLRMPASLEAGKAHADVSNGVLTLRVPKSESAKAKKIAVKAN